MSQVCQPGLKSVQDALKTQFAILCDQCEGVRVGDVGAIHDMRVASRRLRMALKIYRPYLKKSVRKTLNREARSITRSLGRRRELDVMVAMLKDHREETDGLWLRFMDHIIALLERRQARELRSCIAVVVLVEGDALETAHEALLASIDTADCCVVPMAEEELLDALDCVRITRKCWKKSGDPEDLHEVRIAIKHFRYACEFYQPVFDSPLGAYIEQLKAFQSILGEWNDCRVLADMVRTLGGAVAYDLAQGAPLVAEAYEDRALILEEKFTSRGKAFFAKSGRMAFEVLLETNRTDCCSEEAEVP